MIAKSKKPYVLLLLILIAAVAVAWWWLGGKGETSAKVAQLQGNEVWTCSMHPQVRLPKPGKCPICSMPLIPASKAQAKNGDGDQGMLEVSEHARAMASVETVVIEPRKLEHELRVVGKVQFNERALASVTTRVEGYVERLFVDYTGVLVKKGDHLVEIYSPDLVVAQQELLLATESSRTPAQLQSSKLKLLRWGLTTNQVDELIKNKTTHERLTLFSPVTGTVIEKMVVEQSAVKPGDVLYRLANLESVWVYLDVYEYELPWVQYGQTAEITSEAVPGRTFSGRVWFINPVLNEETRTVRVLLNLTNEEQLLKPGMFVSAVIRAKLLSDGKPAQSGVEGQWTCPMHPQVLNKEAGKCPVCGMELEQIPGTPQRTEGGEEILSVPVSAVLDSGTRKLVYVERSRGQFEAREITTGPRAGGFYPVLTGLKEGERVAARGSFLLDSQFQIQGLPSLFYPEGQSGTAGHDHGGTGTPAQAPAKATGHEGHQTQPKEHKH